MKAGLRRRRFLAASGALGLAGAVAGAAALAAGGSQQRVVRVVAKKFEFLPGTIEARVGETLLLELSAPEVPMGFSLADFHLRADPQPGQPATLRVTLDRAGSFTFVCDVFCGSGHEDMSGLLVVTA